MSKSKCRHTATKGRKGEKGSWCVSCLEKIFNVEPNKCKDCLHFNDFHYDYKICRKHSMRVIESMHATYKIVDGSCWEKRSLTSDDKYKLLRGL